MVQAEKQHIDTVSAIGYIGEAVPADSGRCGKLPAGRKYRSPNDHPATPGILGHSYTNPDTIPKRYLPYHIIRIH